MTQERKAKTASGYKMLVVLFVLQLVTLGLVMIAPGALKVVAILLAVPVAIGWGGFFMVAPNEARVMQLFGSYAGSEREPGLRWANPFYTKKRVSLRVRNFESGKLKVNDSDGNPIEIAAVVVWKVVDSAEAVFEVDDYESFVTIQSESAIRNLASTHPYDRADGGEISLRSNSEDVIELLKVEIQKRLEKAGVETIEARISHLAYAPEIASAMLQRQQAGAIVAARYQIVEGAVSIVQHALEKLTQFESLELDAERKAAMVSNLLVVLCGEHSVKPVVNTGSLYT